MNNLSTTPLVKFVRGKPKVTFLVGVHGDERAPIKAAKRLVMFLKKRALVGFQVIYANPLAIKKKKRFMQKDLNYSFLIKEANNYEEKVAFELVRLLKKSEYVFDFHSTKFISKPYCIMANRFQDTKQILSWIKMQHCILVKRPSIINNLHKALAFEVGFDKDVKTQKVCYSLMRNIISYFEEIPSKKEKVKSITFFNILGSIKKDPDFRLSRKFHDFDFLRKNQKIGVVKDKSILSPGNCYIHWVKHPAYLNLLRKIDY